MCRRPSLAARRLVASPECTTAPRRRGRVDDRGEEAPKRRPRHARRGMTLVELLIAVAILVGIAGTLAVLAQAVERGHEYCEGYGTATQHARVALDRITAAVREATANEQFPGVLVLADQVGAHNFPDVLVVWRPTGLPADPAGLPRYNELVVFAPDWYRPNELVEIRAPNDTRTVPPVADTAAWQQQIAALRRSATVETVRLTSLLRTAVVADGAGDAVRGALRFTMRLRPSQAEWDQYRAGNLAWDALPWVQGIFSAKTGLRQSWVRIELQIDPGDDWAANETDAPQPIAFFGSAAVYYQLPR